MSVDKLQILRLFYKNELTVSRSMAASRLSRLYDTEGLDPKAWLFRELKALRIPANFKRLDYNKIALKVGAPLRGDPLPTVHFPGHTGALRGASVRHLAALAHTVLEHFCPNEDTLDVPEICARSGYRRLVASSLLREFERMKLKISDGQVVSRAELSWWRVHTRVNRAGWYHVSRGAAGLELISVTSTSTSKS